MTGKLFPLPPLPLEDWQSSRQATSDKHQKSPSQATRLVALATEAGCELFRTPDGDAYATVHLNGHMETWPLKSGGFRNWLCRLYYEQTNGTPSTQAVQDALNVLKGRAMFDGPSIPVFVRLARHGDAVYLDLANETWSAIEITPSGWSEVHNTPVKFRRTKGMLPLPSPVRGGSTSLLKLFVNLDHENFVLLLGFLVAALRPEGPYPLLLLVSEQGSGKTILARIASSLIDPHAAPLRSEPRCARDLMIGATNSWLLCFDNLSHIPGWLSDALCRLSTGGGFSTRELYSDAEELILEAQRPVVLTSIEDVATRGDLLERSMVLTLKSIPDSQRKPESTLWSTYEAVRPRILGALLDAVSLAMKNLPNTQLDALPRMADFALWATAAEAGLGLQPGEFMRSYTGNRANANSLALDAEPVAAQLMEFMDTQPNGEWEGTASDLLQRLTAPFGDKKPPAGWPKNARSLGSGLRRLAPSLRRGVGLDLMFDEHKRLEGRSVRIIRIRKDPDLCVNTVNVTSDDTARVDASISGVDAIDDVRLEVASTSGC